TDRDEPVQGNIDRLELERAGRVPRRLRKIRCYAASRRLEAIRSLNDEPLLQLARGRDADNASVLWRFGRSCARSRQRRRVARWHRELRRPKRLQREGVLHTDERLRELRDLALLGSASACAGWGWSPCQRRRDVDGG